MSFLSIAGNACISALLALNTSVDVQFPPVPDKPPLEQKDAAVELRVELTLGEAEHIVTIDPFNPEILRDPNFYQQVFSQFMANTDASLQRVNARLARLAEDSVGAHEFSEFIRDTQEMLRNAEALCIPKTYLFVPREITAGTVVYRVVFPGSPARLQRIEQMRARLNRFQQL